MHFFLHFERTLERKSELWHDFFPMNVLPSLFGWTLSQLEQLCRDLNAPRYTARQLAEWMYHKDCRSFAAMSNLPRVLRSRLEASFTLDRPDPHLGAASADGTKKYLFPVPSGTVEAAYIPEDERATLCLSTQAGCKMGCKFCMTGRLGFQGNLESGQILGQYAQLPERSRITNLVFMGMGEPLDNMAAVLQALEVLISDWGYGLSHQRICVSTVGVLPYLEEFLRKTPVRLALSVHSPFDEERARLMPCQKVWPIGRVIDLLRRHEDGKRRIYVEYIVFDGLNDSPRHARELVRLLHGLEVRVNLIKFHNVPGTEFQAASRKRMEEFQRVLLDKGIRTTIRKSRGEDIEAACGLLGSRGTYAGY